VLGRLQQIAHVANNTEGIYFIEGKERGAFGGRNDETVQGKHNTRQEMRNTQRRKRIFSMKMF
jgi:hypothetical protein